MSCSSKSDENCTKIKIFRTWLMGSLYRHCSAPTNPWWYDKSMFEAIKSLPLGTRILNLGSKNTKLETEATPINLDIRFFPNVDVLGDGHQLPFRDNSFDCVLCNAVLEHVPYPQKVADEIIRVLKGGGYACIQVPFLEVVHYSPGDYYRFTPNGLQVLFKNLEEIKSGVSAGPSQTVADVIREYVPLFFHNTIFYNPLRLIMSWVVIPIRALDYIFKLKKDICIFCLNRAYYFIGRKGV